MTKLNTMLAAVAGAFFLSSGAMAASLQPAAGQGPFFDQMPVSTASTTTRSAVEAQVAASRPVSGNLPIPSQVAANDPASTLTRAEVSAQAAEFHPAAGQMSAGSWWNGQGQMRQASAQVTPNAS